MKTPDAMGDVPVSEICDALALLVPGAEVDVSASQYALLDRLTAAGLVVRVTDVPRARDALATRRAVLDALDADDPTIPALRSEILDLSEALATLDGAAFVATGGGGGAYRGAMPAQRRALALTHAGRAQYAHLAPRASRAPQASLSEFSAQLAALEALFAMRAQRANALVARVADRTDAIELHVIRSAMLGLASLPESTDALGDAFVVLFTGLRDARKGEPYSAAQDVTAAESFLLHHGSTGIAYDPQVPGALAAWRSELTRRHCQGRTEDALDAMLLLAAVAPDDRDARIARAARFGRAMASAELRTPLSLALLATADGEDEAHVTSTVAAYRAVSAHDPLERLTVAVLAAVQRTFSLETQLARIEKLHAGLARLGPSEIRIAAALLALLDGDEDGVLEDVRLASRAIDRSGLARGAEATSLGLKLLLDTALLARGDEGDPEESLVLALRALPGIAALDLGTRGLGTMSATLPLLSGSVAAFHRPMLDAAVLYETARQEAARR